MKKLLIFDLDGTLVNTIADLGNACNHALETMGFPTHSQASYTKMVGNGISKLIERAVPEDARRQRVIEAMRTRFVEYYNDHLWDETVPYPGVEEMLGRIRSMGIKTAVASNKYQSATERIVRHFFGNDWVSIMGQQDMVPLKPDPSIVFNILLECPTPKSEVLYVGDSAVDMETAYRACVDKAGITWGFGSRKELMSAFPDFIVNKPEELIEILGSNTAPNEDENA